MKPNKQESFQSTPSKMYGRIYTPDTIVTLILDYVGYTEDILHKHIIDNSCGNGAFLSCIVIRYCQVYLQKSKDKKQLATELSQYIHGIEIDATEQQACIANLNQIVNAFGVDYVDWDIICADTLLQTQYNGKMDFVVGNPPYVRVHNLKDNYDVVKQYSFAQKGMTDLFIVFYEIGFRMLNSHGKMCIITSNSWLNSKAGKVLRKYIITHKNLSGIIDLEHYQVFNATTYTMISLFDNQRNTIIDYQTYDGTLHSHGKLNYSDFIIQDDFYFSSIAALKELRAIRCSMIPQYAKVRNGYATLADKVFIGEHPFQYYTIDVIKASTGKWTKCVFPYDTQGKPLRDNIFLQSDAYKYLCQHKEQLSKGKDSLSAEWYLFGRSQAINDTFKNKIAINTIIKNKGSIRLTPVPMGKGVYSGLYILTELSFDIISSIIISDEFMQYVYTLKNYKSGGYYTFSSKDLELFINFKIQKNYGQSSISHGYNSLF